MGNCERCEKPEYLCVCKDIVPRQNRVRVVILRHPQEPDKDLGSARLTNLILGNSVLKTGLSISNLKKVAGEDADPSRWIVLFLGSKYKFREIERRSGSSMIYLFDRTGAEVEYPFKNIQGLVALDGTWAQAKALWWRNPWLLKLKRAVLDPHSGSLYGTMRREPRRECLSSIESIAYTLEILGEDPSICRELIDHFSQLVARYRTWRELPSKDSGQIIEQ